MAGQSLNEFLVARMGDIARTPSVEELAGASAPAVRYQRPVQRGS